MMEVMTEELIEFQDRCYHSRHHALHASKRTEKVEIKAFKLCFAIWIQRAQQRLSHSFNFRADDLEQQESYQSQAWFLTSCIR